MGKGEGMHREILMKLSSSISFCVFRPLQLVLVALVVFGLIMTSAGSGNAQAQGLSDIQLLDLVKEGEWRAATREAEFILQSEPNNFTALIVLARVNRAQGDISNAGYYARRASSAAKSDEERYVASIEMASVYYTEEKFLLSQYWLRRAYQFAPSPEMQSQTAKNIRGVQVRSPFQWQFQVGVTPSSNVNNGSVAENVDIGDLNFTLNPDAKAMSGIEKTASAGVRYRFGGNAPYTSYVSLLLFTKQVSLSSSAKENVPDAEGSDYNFDLFEVGYGHSFSERSDQVRYRLDATAGRNFYGEKPLSRYARTAISATVAHASNSETTYMVSAERQIRDDVKERSAWITQLSALQAWRLPSGDGLQLLGGVRHTASDSVEIDHNAVFLRGAYRWQDIFGGTATLSLDLGLEFRDYDASPYRVGGRHDSRFRASAELGLPKIQYYGFTPVIGIDVNKTMSDVDLYDSDDIGLQLEVRSAF